MCICVSKSQSYKNRPSKFSAIIKIYEISICEMVEYFMQPFCTDNVTIQLNNSRKTKERNLRLVKNWIDRVLTLCRCVMVHSQAFHLNASIFFSRFTVDSLLNLRIYVYMYVWLQCDWLHNWLKSNSCDFVQK